MATEAKKSRREIDPASIRAVNKILETPKPAKIEQATIHPDRAATKKPSVIRPIQNKPKEMVPPGELSGEAADTIAKLNELLEAGNGEELGDLIFDVECDDELAAQIDIQWYTEKCP